MTKYEWMRLLSMPIMPSLYGEVRGLLRTEVPAGSSVLDVGGRKSWYTVGLPFDVAVSDLPRESSVQHQLGLGVTDSIASNLKSSRSNVTALVYDDLTNTNLTPESFDAVVSIEVIEHVDDDVSFVRNIASVLRPGGVAVLTTPNGDRTPVPVGDHRRHYTRAQLDELLRSSFEQVSVNYAVPATGAWYAGLRSLNPKKPLQAARSISGNMINRVQAHRPLVRYDPTCGAHLIALVRKA